MPTTDAIRKTSLFAQPATEQQLAKAKKALESHGFKVEIVDTLADAKTAVAKLIPKGSEVFTGTSETLRLAGLDKELNESGEYVSVRQKFMPLANQPDKAVEMRRIGSASDYAIGSVHAITEDGQVLIASASGSQIPNYAYGASNFIWVVGSQKIVKDLEEGLERIEKHTFPLEDQRALKAYGANSSINKILIYRKEPQGRGTIILIREPVGF
ncbi:MAG TPA: LUD domain-containing protein [Candidatus Saccharimonadales bacterium]|nr:LUD domain-containing protein [Candidatus Saccharimonadales bacterium]